MTSASSPRLGRKGISRRPLRARHGLFVRVEADEHRDRDRTWPIEEAFVPLQARSGITLDVDDALRGVVALGWLEAERPADGALAPAFAAERDTSIDRLVRQFAGRQAADIPGV